MKIVMIRISILTVVLAFGLIAITWARHSFDDSATDVAPPSQLAGTSGDSSNSWDTFQPSDPFESGDAEQPGMIPSYEHPINGSDPAWPTQDPSGLPTGQTYCESSAPQGSSLQPLPSTLSAPNDPFPANSYLLDPHVQHASDAVEMQPGIAGQPGGYSDDAAMPGMTIAAPGMSSMSDVTPPPAPVVHATAPSPSAAALPLPDPSTAANYPADNGTYMTGTGVGNLPNSGLGATASSPGQTSVNPGAAPIGDSQASLSIGAVDSQDIAMNSGMGAASQPLPLGNTGPGSMSGSHGMSGSNMSSYADMGGGLPGERITEGPQAPRLDIQKIAPAEVQIGSAAKFAIEVRNLGSAVAYDVRIRDLIPKGTRLISTDPAHSRDESGGLLWSIDTLRPNEKATIEMVLMPLEEGEIGSEATVQFAIRASARTIATRPLLEIATSIPTQVNLGEQVEIKIQVTNPGTGTTTGVVLDSLVPAGLQHPAGAEVEYELGELKPGQSKEISLFLKCVKAGMITNVVRARADANLEANDTRQFDVVAPELEIAVDGSKQRYLESQAVYQLSIGNPGTATAQMVELAAFLPEGLRFESANNQGHYDPATHSVRWRIKELRVGERGSVELRTLPQNPGEQMLRVESHDASGLTVKSEHPVSIDGIPAVSFEVSDSIDPVDVSGETTYDIQISNQGTKAATNVQVVVHLPPELEVVKIKAPVQHRLDEAQNMIIFEPLGQLNAKDQTVYQVRVQGVRPGDARLKVQVQSADMQTPVSKEESTRVFSDQ